MSRVVLVQASPRLASTGATAPVRLAGGGSRAFTHLGFSDWLDGVMGEPLFTSLVGFDKDGWNGAAIPSTAAIGVATTSARRAADLAALVWSQAAITVQTGDDSVTDPVWSTRLAGKVAGVAAKGGVLSLTVADLSAALNVPVCPVAYAGTGGLEGGASLTGQPKRRSWGRVFNVEGVLADSANNIYEFGDPAFPLSAFVAVKDRGRAGPVALVPAGATPQATLAALANAVVPAGGAAVAPSIARVKWWTQPSGPLTADLLGEVGTGYVETAPAIAAAIAAAVVPALPVAGLADAIVARPDPAGWHVGNASDTAAAVMLKLLLGASMIWTISPAGALQMLTIGFDNPVETIDFDSVERLESYPPVTGVKVTYALNNRVQTDAEISAAVLAGDVSGLGPLATAATADYATQVSGAAKPADNATVGATVGTDLKAADGHVLFPAEVLNSALVLAPDGTLSAAIAGVATVLGKVKLPDLGAATDASRRQLEADLASLSAAVAQLTTGQAIVQNVFRDAGLFTDRASGLTKLYAIESRAQQITSLSVSLNAALGTIGLKADVNYVNQAILTAQLGGSSADLSSLLVRLSSAEANINGLQATVQLKADATVVTGLQGTVTAVQQSLDALNATVATKASQTQVDAQGQRLTIAEQTLSAFDGASIAQTVTASRRVPADADSAGTTAILDLLNGASSTQLALTGIAQARQELGARVGGAFDAVASLSLQLGVQIGAVTAAAASETAARIGADQASAATLAAYQTSIAGNLAGINTAIGAVSTKTDATAQSLSDFQASTAQNLAGINQKLTATTGEADATAAAVTALQASTAQGFASANQTFAAQSGVNNVLAGRIDTVSTKVDGNSTTLTQYGQSLNGLGAKWGVEINANGVITGMALNNASGRTDLLFMVNGLKIAQPDGSGARTVFNITDGGIVQMRGVQVDSLTVGSVGFDQLLLGAAQKCAFYSTTDDLSIGQNQTGTIATVTFVKEDASSVLKLVLFGNCYSPDDLQFVGNIMLDGSSVQSARVNIVLDTQTSQGEMPITPFKFLSGVAAGQHTVSFTMQNTNVKNLALTVRAGATLEVTELRKGSIGSATGSGGQIASSPASGGTSGGGGSNAGGTYTGAGQQQ